MSRGLFVMSLCQLTGAASLAGIQLPSVSCDPILTGLEAPVKKQGNCGSDRPTVLAWLGGPGLVPSLAAAEPHVCQAARCAAALSCYIMWQRPNN